jgi:hypothetical protein
MRVHIRSWNGNDHPECALGRANRVATQAQDVSVAFVLRSALVHCFAVVEPRCGCSRTARPVSTPVLWRAIQAEIRRELASLRFSSTTCRRKTLSRFFQIHARNLRMLLHPIRSMPILPTQLRTSRNSRSRRCDPTLRISEAYVLPFRPPKVLCPLAAYLRRAVPLAYRLHFRGCV